MGKQVLLIAAHTDDEVLGCGGAIARHAASGDDVVAIHLTDGVGARDGADATDVELRSEASQQSADVLGFEWVDSGCFPDNQLDTVPLLELVKFVEKTKRAYQPDLVYTHHGGDLNVDHRLTFQATMTAFRPQPSEKRVEIRSFEVPSSTEWSHRTMGGEFRPNLYVDISEHWEAKQAALEAYAAEIRPAPHSRSMDGLNELTGRRGSEVGVQRAEAFELIRRIE